MSSRIKLRALKRFGLDAIRAVQERNLSEICSSAHAWINRLNMNRYVCLFKELLRCLYLKLLKPRALTALSGNGNRLSKEISPELFDIPFVT